MYDIKKELGRKIKQIRKMRNLTQERLAELVGIGTPNISYIETGRFAPSVDTLQKIAIALKVEPYELYKFDNSKTDEELYNELFCALKEDKKLLKLVYNFFLAVRFM